MEVKKIIWENSEYDPNWNYIQKAEYFNKGYTHINDFLIVKTYEKNSVYMARYSTLLYHVGRRIFTKAVCIWSITFKNNKIYGNLKAASTTEFKDCLEILNIKFDPADCDLIRRGNNTILKQVLAKKIYNRETLTKAIGRINFKLKHFSWKLLYQYLMDYHSIHVSVNDIKDFTTNVDLSLERILKDDILFADAIRSAKLLDEKVNPLWSEKRLQNEHNRQIRTMNASLIALKDETSIYDENLKQIINDDHVKIVSSEKEAYLEGLHMSNCVYTNYWGAIKGNSYLVAHLSLNGENCSIGIRYNGTSILLDQVYKEYNQIASEEAHAYARRFFTKNYGKIIQLLKKRSV